MAVKIIEKATNIKKIFNKINLKKPPKSLVISFIVLLILGLIYFSKSLFVAALVNGRPILRFNVVKELENQAGGSVLDSLIEKSLVIQEIGKQKIEISKEEIDNEIKRIEELLTAQEMSLDQALSLRGQTRNNLIEQIKIQKGVEKILSSNINVSDQEILEYFNKNKEYFGKSAKLEQFKDQIKEELFSQKLSTEYTKWISDIKAKSKINYFVKY